MYIEECIRKLVHLKYMDFKCNITAVKNIIKCLSQHINNETIIELYWFNIFIYFVPQKKVIQVWNGWVNDDKNFHFHFISRWKWSPDAASAQWTHFIAQIKPHTNEKENDVPLEMLYLALKDNLLHNKSALLAYKQDKTNRRCLFSSVAKITSKH